jgi:DNA-binding CsgD family transcriptional regulator
MSAQIPPTSWRLRGCEFDPSVSADILIAEASREVLKGNGDTWIVGGADRRQRRAFVDLVALSGRDAGLDVIVCRSELSPTTLVGLAQVGLRKRLLTDPPGLGYAAEAVRRALALPLLSESPSEAVDFEAAFASLVLAWASQRPMLLVLSELSGAVDVGVTRTVGHLASAVIDAPVLVVVTVDESVDPLSAAVLDRIVEAGQAKSFLGAPTYGSNAQLSLAEPPERSTDLAVRDDSWILDAIENSDWTKLACAEALPWRSQLADAWLTMLRGSGDPTRVLLAHGSLPSAQAGLRAVASGCVLLALSGAVSLAADWLSAASMMFEPLADEPRYLLGAKTVLDWQAGRWDRALGCASSVRMDEGEGGLAWWAALAETAICAARGISPRLRPTTQELQTSEPLRLWATSGPCSVQLARVRLDQIEIALCESAAQGDLLWAPMLCGRLIELALDAGDEVRARSWTRELDNLAPRFSTPWAGILALLAHSQVDGDMSAAWEAASLAETHGMEFYSLLARYHIGRLGGPQAEAVGAFVGLRSLGAGTWQRRALRVLRQRAIPIPRSPRRDAASRESQAGLTDLEYQLACAAAEGATNPELAATFALSRRTVEARLTGVYRKLGCRSRFDLQAAISGGLSQGGSPRSSSL